MNDSLITLTGSRVVKGASEQSPLNFSMSERFAVGKCS